MIIRDLAFARKLSADSVESPRTEVKIKHWWQIETGWAIAANLMGVEELPVEPGLPTKAVPGYYLTGDAGMKDEDGYLFIMSRIDDIINVAGHRLSTGGMEDVLSSHPDVAERAVIGAADKLKGELPLGMVVLEDGVDREIQDIRRQVERDDAQAYLQREGDLDFHYRVVEGCRNSRLQGLLCNDLYHLVRMYRCQFRMASPRAGRALDEHSHIADAIESRDGELAEILMRRHIRASRKNVEQRLSEDRATSTGPEDVRREAELA